MWEKYDYYILYEDYVRKYDYHNHVPVVNLYILILEMCDLRN